MTVVTTDLSHSGELSVLLGTHLSRLATLTRASARFTTVCFPHNACRHVPRERRRSAVWQLPVTKNDFAGTSQMFVVSGISPGCDDWGSSKMFWRLFSSGGSENQVYSPQICTSGAHCKKWSLKKSPYTLISLILRAVISTDVLCNLTVV